MQGGEFPAALADAGQHRNTGVSPITFFEDQVCNLEIIHQFHRVGLLHCRINQWAPVILWLKNCREEPVIVLSPMGQDEVAPSIVCVLFKFIIVELQSGAANTVMQAYPCWVVVGVEVIWLCIPHIAGGVDEAVRQVCGNGHGTPEVADEEAKGVLLARVTPCLNSITHCLEVNLYVLDEVQNLVQSIQVGLNPVDNKSHVDIGDLLMLAVCLEDQEDGSGPAYFRRALQLGGPECAFGDEFLQTVKRDALHVECSSYRTEADITQIESVLTMESLPWDGAWVLQH